LLALRVFTAGGVHNFYCLQVIAVMVKTSKTKGIFKAAKKKKGKNFSAFIVTRFTISLKEKSKKTGY